ncbi:MAG: hypothetical protein RL695_387 [Pseudomonadota bacterium]|jgi:hypothetical protein
MHHTHTTKAIAAAVLLACSNSIYAQCAASTSSGFSLALQANSSSTGALPCATASLNIDPLIPYVIVNKEPSESEKASLKAAYPQFGTKAATDAAYPQFTQFRNITGNELNLAPGFGSISTFVAGILVNLRSETVQGGNGLTNTTTVEIPVLGINKSFTSTGTNPSNASITAMTSYLDTFDTPDSKSKLIAAITAWSARNTTTSPLTGVSGLMPVGMATDFNTHFTSTATNIATPANVPGQAAQQEKLPNLVGAGLEYASITQNDTKVKSFTLPMSYTIRNDLDPRRQLVISLPITYVDNGSGNKSGSAGLGVAYRLPVTDNWTLVPSGKYSVVVDAGQYSAASVWNASLTSVYLIPGEGYDVAVGNMLGYNKTGTLAFKGYSIDPDLKYWMTRNGVMLSQPVTLAGKRFALEYSLIDMRYLGSDKPLIDNTQEIGVTLGTNKTAFSARSFFRAGISYVTAKETKGFRMNFSYWF